MTTNFNQKRFVDLGQTLYTTWLATASGLGQVTEAERREAFNKTAIYAFEAAEEFAKVFQHQEED
ncbi:hypothetical protein b3_0164 [Synechococcus phage B3]|nr:hypothetical protein b3_0164 [Synechococcus phage B3]QGT54778.1 hypothetical protein b23_0163 [Synechococcus phage B23]